MPAGFGVQGKLGEGPCFHHCEQSVVVGGKKMVAVAKEISDLAPSGKKNMFRYRMRSDTRLGEILDEMGAEQCMPKGAKGVEAFNLDYELAMARAMLILFTETHAKREHALLLWAKAYEKGELVSPPPRVLSVLDGHKAVMGVVDIVKKMDEMLRPIPVEHVMQMLREMGDSVNSHVHDPAVKRQIQSEWLHICNQFVPQDY